MNKTKRKIFNAAIKLFAEKGYDIIIERGVLKRAGEELNLDRKVLIVTDSGIPSQYANEIAKQTDRPTAIITAYAEIGIGLIHQLIRLGISVPDDISVLTRNNIPACEYSQVPVTTFDLFDEEIAKKIRGSFKEKEEKPVAKNKKEVKKDKNASEGHVIIRREVIVSEENKKPERTNANKNVGFNEQTRNKDYNIVYRNKQTRPMTVNELFGIPTKKEEKKAQPVQKPAEPVKVEKEIKVEKEKEEVKKSLPLMREVASPQGENGGRENKTLISLPQPFASQNPAPPSEGAFGAVHNCWIYRIPCAKRKIATSRETFPFDHRSP